MGKVTLVAAVVLSLMAATPLQAREDGDDAAPTASDDILDGAITCVAAYDNILASGDNDSDDLSAVAGARAAAIDLYAQISGESRDQIAQDIRQADADLPAELAGEGDTLDNYAATCDAAFMDVRHDMDDDELIA